VFQRVDAVRKPILSEDFGGMLGPIAAVAAPQVGGGTIPIAPPTDTFWVLRVQR
jgi:hypothetical protein